MLIVTNSFCGHGFNMPEVGSRINPPEPLAAHLVAIGVAAYMETKVLPLPVEAKKNAEPLESLPAAPAAPKKTRKVSAKKSKR